MKKYKIENVSPISVAPHYRNGVRPKTVNEYVVELPSGRKAKLTFTHSTDIVLRRAKIYGRVVRNTKGKPVQFPVEVQATKLTLMVEKRTMLARSCCKPPDVFCPLKGRLFALRHLFRNDTVYFLKAKDREYLINVAKITPKQLKRREERNGRNA